jgi:hypothetical protein
VKAGEYDDPSSPYGCCTQNEIDSILYLFSTPNEREQEKEKARRYTWKDKYHCLHLEDFEKLDEIIANCR